MDSEDGSVGSDDYEEHRGDWMRLGRKDMEKRAKEDDGYAEYLKENMPRFYHSLDWTPEDPKL